MSQLTFSNIPGFFDIPDATIAGGQPLTDDAMAKISHNAKFGAVRVEPIYMGYYRDSDIVPVPVSLVDGYVYTRIECLFFLILASTRSPAAGFVPGQALFPTLANNDVYTGTLVAAPYQLFIQGSTGTTPGKITCQVYGSTSGAAAQGTVAVYALGIRSSVGG